MTEQIAEQEQASAAPAAKRAPKVGDAVHYYTINPDEQRVRIGSGPYPARIDALYDGEVVGLVVSPPHGPHYSMKCRHVDDAGRDGRWWEWPKA